MSDHITPLEKAVGLDDIVIKCMNCRYWQKGENYNAIPDEFEEHYGKCINEAFEYENQVEGRTDMLIYGDYESYSAGFDTGEDFGCVHFELKRKVKT